MKDLVLQKPKWKPRQAALPLTKVLTQAEVIVILTRQVFEDARAAGWLKPCCHKPTARGEGREFYGVSGVEDVQNRMLAGEYPGSDPAIKHVFDRKKSSRAVEGAE